MVRAPPADRWRLRAAPGATTACATCHVATPVAEHAICPGAYATYKSGCRGIRSCEASSLGPCCCSCFAVSAGVFAELCERCSEVHEASVSGLVRVPRSGQSRLRVSRSMVARACAAVDAADVGDGATRVRDVAQPRECWREPLSARLAAGRPRAHICTGTGRIPPTSASGPGPPLPHLHWNGIVPAAPAGWVRAVLHWSCSHVPAHVRA